MRLLALATCLFLVPACGSGGGEENALPFPPADRDNAPDPMLPGPFPVGVTTLEFSDGSRTDPDTGGARVLRVEVWYPALQNTRGQPTVEYKPHEEASPEYLGEQDYQKLVEAQLPGMVSWAVRDAQLDYINAPYPLLLFSHGSYGVRWQSVFYTVHLASHGYIVVSPDHKGNTVWELLRDGFDDSSTITSSSNRLTDIDFLLRQFLIKNTEEGDIFDETIDEDHVGSTGHSFGAWTAFTTACNNPGIHATVPQSPVMGLAEIFGCMMAEYPVPVLVMGGTMDNTVPWKDQYCEYRLLNATDQYLYELEGGGHYTFSNICDLDLVTLAEDFDFGTAEEAMQDGCSPTDNVPWPDAHQSINHYATAFFNLYLRDSTGSADYLVPVDDPLFDPVTFHGRTVPDWPEGGCTAE
jgi:predicted dienelactone hydrolase